MAAHANLIWHMGRACALRYQNRMRPRFYPSLVNDRSGDPAVFVDFLMERRAVLIDLGDISALNGRAAQRITDVFVSHTHIDHFIGFDRLLRLFVGRPKHLRLHGPAGFIDRVDAKLSAYTWNLAGRFQDDLVLDVVEIADDVGGKTARFRLTNRFGRENEAPVAFSGGVIRGEPSLSMRCAVLDHRIPCLAYALQETKHVNVWRNRVDELGLAVGPWLDELKAAVHAGLPDDTPIVVPQQGEPEGTLPLGFLKENIVTISPGQKIAYVTDAAFTPANADAIVDLASGADILFIEAVFADADGALARDRAHLTTVQAGSIARRAGVRRVESFHFSARYEGRHEQLLEEVQEAFQGRRSPR